MLNFSEVHLKNNNDIGRFTSESPSFLASFQGKDRHLNVQMRRVVPMGGKLRNGNLFDYYCIKKIKDSVSNTKCEKRNHGSKWIPHLIHT